MVRLTVQQRRSLLVEAAFRVIARGGVEAATTRAICAEADMAQAAFHYAFPSRDELLAAVVARGVGDELNAVTAPLVRFGASAEAPDGIEELLRAGLLGYLGSLEQDPDREKALITLSQYAQRTPGLEQFAQKMYQRYYETAARALDAAAQVCDIRWAKPTSYLAPLVVSATDGLTLAYLNTGDRDVSERIVEATVRMLLGYVVPVEILVSAP